MTQLKLPPDNRKGKRRGRKPRKFAYAQYKIAFSIFGEQVYKKWKKDKVVRISAEVEELEKRLREILFDIKMGWNN